MAIYQIDPAPSVQPLRDTVAWIVQWSTSGWTEGGFSCLILWLIGLLSIVLLSNAAYRLLLWIATRLHRCGAAFYLPAAYHYAAGLITLGLIGWLVYTCAVPFGVIRDAAASGMWFVSALGLFAVCAWLCVSRPDGTRDRATLLITAALLALATSMIWHCGWDGVAWAGHASLVAAWLVTAPLCVAASVRELERIRMLCAGVNRGAQP